MTDTPAEDLTRIGNINDKKPAAAGADEENLSNSSCCKLQVSTAAFAALKWHLKVTWNCWGTSNVQLEKREIFIFPQCYWALLSCTAAVNFGCVASYPSHSRDHHLLSERHYCGWGYDRPHTRSRKHAKFVSKHLLLPVGIRKSVRNILFRCDD